MPSPAWRHISVSIFLVPYRCWRWRENKFSEHFVSSGRTQRRVVGTGALKFQLIMDSELTLAVKRRAKYTSTRNSEDARREANIDALQLLTEIITHCLSYGGQHTKKWQKHLSTWAKVSSVGREFQFVSEKSNTPMVVQLHCYLWLLRMKTCETSFLLAEFLPSMNFPVWLSFSGIWLWLCFLLRSVQTDDRDVPHYTWRLTCWPQHNYSTLQ